ncbi:sensor histidine kinase [Nesterenkonia halotolerans]|uniref:sensor histidine kinase n=1 Tax=Nesterenkonia halotolerans TaxID=225325 RepID=UPI003EE7E2E1
MSDFPQADAGPHRLRLLGGRPLLRAALISVCCTLLGAGAFLVLLGSDLEDNGGDLPGSAVLLVFLDALIGLAACAVVGPVKGSRVGNLLIVVVAVWSTWAVPAWIVSVVRLGARRSAGMDTVVVLVTVLGGLGYTMLREPAAALQPGESVLTVMVGAAFTAGALLWGRVLGTRSALVAALREQAKSAEHARSAAVLMREAEIAQARAEERSAIARDMHDGISHQLAIVAMHAGALSYRVDLTADQQRATANTVRDAAAGANVMLREALTALRETDDIRPTSPLPSSSSLQRMVETARAEGAEVSLRWKNLTAAELSKNPQRAMTFARITEELLMNSRKHAPEAAVSLLLEGATDAVVLHVSNPIPRGQRPRSSEPLGTGLGLVGVTERAELLGGSARYGATVLDTFEVEVRIP